MANLQITLLAERPKMKRIKTESIYFEWSYKKPSRGYPRLAAARCWNKPFWYGDGSPATKPSKIVMASDLKKIMAVYRAAMTVARDFSRGHADLAPLLKACERARK